MTPVDHGGPNDQIARVGDDSSKPIQEVRHERENVIWMKDIMTKSNNDDQWMVDRAAETFTTGGTCPTFLTTLQFPWCNYI